MLEETKKQALCLNQMRQNGLGNKEMLPGRETGLVSWQLEAMLMETSRGEHNH
jgi:hypothetical protein